MKLAHLLVHVDETPRSQERVGLAMTLARRTGARVEGLFAEMSAIGSSPIVGRRSPQMMAQAAGEARAAFEGRAAEAGVETGWWQLDPGEYSDVVGMAAACCRYVDLALFGQHVEEDRAPEDLIEQIVLHSGRPVLVVPSTGHHADVGRRVVVAWNGTREASRALNDAIPVIEGAESVTLLALQQPGGNGGAPAPRLDIVAHLASHGIRATYERVVKDDFAVLDTLLNRCFDVDADLLVVGGYGLSGMPLLHRDSTTRQLLRSMITPVLLSQ